MKVNIKEMAIWFCRLNCKEIPFKEASRWSDEKLDGAFQILLLILERKEWAPIWRKDFVKRKSK